MIARPDQLARLENLLQTHGCTPAGADAITKLLDPTCTRPPTGMPAVGARPAVVPRYERQETVNPPAGLPADTNWDLCIVQTGGDNTILYWCAAPAGASFNHLTLGTPGAEFGALLCDGSSAGGSAQAFSLVSDGTTMEEHVVPPPRDIACFKRISASVTVSFTGDALHNGGTVTAATFSSAAEPPYGTIGGAGTTGVAMPLPVSLSEPDMYLQAKSYTGAAAAGVYMPQALLPGDYLPGFNGYRRLHTMDNGVSYTGTGSFREPAGILAYVPDITSDPIRWLSGFAFVDTNIDRSGTSVIIFRGLSPFATLRVKGVLVVEAVPLAGSAEQPYIRQPNPYDPHAMRALTDLRLQLPCAFPADYNFIGALPGILAMIGTAIWGAAKPVLIAGAKLAVGAAATAIANKVTGGSKASENPGKRAKPVAEEKREIAAALPQPRPTRAVQIVSAANVRRQARANARVAARRASSRARR